MFRILTWRYVSTIFLALFCGKNPLRRPYIGRIYGRYLQFRFRKWPLKFNQNGAAVVWIMKSWHLMTKSIESRGGVYVFRLPWFSNAILKWFSWQLYSLNLRLSCLLMRIFNSSRYMLWDVVLTYSRMKDEHILLSRVSCRHANLKNVLAPPPAKHPPHSQPPRLSSKDASASLAGHEKSWREHRNHSTMWGPQTFVLFLGLKPYLTVVMSTINHSAIVKLELFTNWVRLPSSEKKPHGMAPALCFDGAIWVTWK